ncbi:MAG: glycosyltransferase family 4 protein [Streptosporangiaceae bacterium]|nr:glycosyltransferase family 4 protein [Streptosporangiaceae bacterium]MBV9856676.1 glycosyltransferase family 4 protein [Streptosporangiaceae bacterium]
MLRILRLCSVFEPRALTPASVAYDAIGGMQNHVAELTRCLDRLGVSQLVVTSRQAGPADRTQFGDHGELVRTGLPVPVLRQAWAPLAAPYVLRGGSASRVDLVHVHCGEDVAILPLARLAARRHRSPLVATMHLNVRHSLNPTTLRDILVRTGGGAAERWLLPGADAVIALTPSAAGLLRTDGIPADRVHVIPPGYDPALFSEPVADPFPAVPRPRVAYLGRLVPQKDVGTLLRAFARLDTKAHLLLVGDGAARPALQRRARALGGRVHFTGFVRHTQIPAVLRHVDLFVLPSLYEDLSSALIEAMAAGLPVVATRVGGTADLVRDGENGLLVTPRDPAALAAAIGRLLADPGLAARLSSAARQTAAAYAWPDLASKVLDIYRRLTGK